jgi:penicillin-binding protein 2
MFGLDSVTGIELPETTPTISTESVVRSAIGQGTNNYTAAQLVRYITAVANSGSLYELTILDKITDSEGNVIEQKEPVLTNTISLQQSTWDTIHKGMYRVCNESSYRTQMGNLGVTLAGKSGTAQESETKPNHGLFVGYAPYEDPEIAAVLIIPNGHGSSKVLDLYSELMCYYFNIPYSQDDDETVSSGRTANIPSTNIQSD